MVLSHILKYHHSLSLLYLIGCKPCYVFSLVLIISYNVLMPGFAQVKTRDSYLEVGELSYSYFNVKWRNNPWVIS